MSNKSLLLKSLIALMLFGLFACSDSEEIKVGVILPQEGSLQGYGFQVQSGLEMAEEHINQLYEAGKKMSDEDFEKEYGFPKVKRKITLIKGHHESSNYEDVQMAIDSFKALNKEGVSVIIGPASSAGVLALTKMANEERVPIISPSATSPDINREGGDYIFRVYPSDTLEAQKLSYVLFSECFSHKLLVVRSRDSYGEGISLEILRFARRQSDQIPNFVVKFDPNPSEEEVVGVVDKIVEEKPVAIFLGAYADSMIPIIKEIKKRPELERLYIWCASSFLPDQMIEGVGADNLENVMFTMYPWDTDSDDEQIVAFTREFEEKFGTKPNIFAACGYDALKVVSLALNDTNLDLKDMVKMALNKVHYENGLLDETDFDKRGDVTRIPYVYKIVEGEVVPLSQEDMSAIKTDVLTRIDDDEEPAEETPAEEGK
ncbi:MAG: hypothetical protein CR997_02855 [Acidobacteria bacterium]|nr:MAG: hypothetical protein CR997_02855 [Acidobacteriota bacterium]